MDTKFTYYDIIGFIIPGAVVVAILYWFVTGFLALPPTIGISISDAIIVLIFVAGSYFLGHVVHVIGAILLRDKDKTANLNREYFEENAHYSPQYKCNLAKILYESFTPELDWVTDPKDFREKIKAGENCDIKLVDERRIHEVFHLCHTMLRKEGLSDNTDTLAAISNMYRGLYGAAFISAVVCLLISLKQFILVLFLIAVPGVLPAGPFFTFKEPQLLLGIFLTFIFVLSGRFLLQGRWQAYKGYFVDSIFTAMYVLSQKKQEEQQDKATAAATQSVS